MTLATLKQRPGSFKHIVAGHDEIYTATERANQAIDYTIQHLESQGFSNVVVLSTTTFEKPCWRVSLITCAPPVAHG